MGTHCVVFSLSIGDPPGQVSRSVTLDVPCIKGYRGGRHAVADALDEPAAHTDPAPRRRVAQAPTHGRRPTSRIGLDPAGDGRDDRAVPVARARRLIVPGGGDPASLRPDRTRDRGAKAGP